MRVEIEVDKDTIHLIPEDDLIASGIDKVRDYFLKELKKYPEMKHIVLNVRDVKFVDSLGVNLIVGLYKEAVAESKTIEIVEAGESFMKIAGFFRLPSLFPIQEAEMSP